MKKGVFILCFLGVVLVGHAQGSLQFNQALLIDSALSTVPANKVWKITAVSGTEFRQNECDDISVNSTHELKSARCGWSATTVASFNANYSISVFSVNNKKIINSVEGLPTNTTIHNVSNCTNGAWSNYNFSCANRASTPNILPMWLPAGTTLRSGGPNTVLSVLEFNIVP